MDIRFIRGIHSVIIACNVTRRTVNLTPHLIHIFCPWQVNDGLQWLTSQIARLTGPSWGPPGDDRTQVGPMLAPWTPLCHSCYQNNQQIRYNNLVTLLTSGNTYKCSIMRSYDFPWYLARISYSTNSLLPVIWDVMALMLYHFNDFNSKGQSWYHTIVFLLLSKEKNIVRQ